MKGKELGKLLLDGLLVAEDGRLVVQGYAHVGPECIHVLADSDLVLLGLIQYVSNRAVRFCTWSSSIVEGLTRPSSWDGCGGGGWVDDCLASP